MPKFDVFGMCNPLYDLQAVVTDELVQELGLEKGGMFLVDEARQAEIVPAIYSNVVLTAAGGSGANTMTGVSLLGGRACYAGRVGNDEHASLYEQGLIDKGVASSLGHGDGATGICLVLVTPDTQRTLCTFLGCCVDLCPDDIRLDLLEASRYLYVTAYLWDTDGQKEAVQYAMRKAQGAGVKVSLSLSDPFCVNRHKQDLLDLTRKHVDIVIGNRLEAEALTDADSPAEAASRLAEHAEIAVVTMDSKGSLICSKGETIEVPAFHVSPVDTTGAGDMYAAGFLYGLSQGFDLYRCGSLASYVAAQVVSQFGPRLDAVDDELVDSIVGANLQGRISASNLA